MLLWCRASAKAIAHKGLVVCWAFGCFGTFCQCHMECALTTLVHVCGAAAACVCRAVPGQQRRRL